MSDRQDSTADNDGSGGTEHDDDGSARDTSRGAGSSTAQKRSRASDDDQGGGTTGGANTGRGNRGRDQTGGEASDGDGDIDLATVCRELGLTPAQARRRLKQAPTWEQRAKDNYEGAQRAKTLEEQLDELRGQIADRDVRDVERNQRVAMTQVREQVAEAGIKPKDVADMLELVDPARLLKDGEPDEDAIAKVAKAITRTGGRATPDGDQGQRGGRPNDMNTLIRQFATGR